MKRLIKADVPTLKNIGIVLNSDLAVNAIQSQAPNFKEIVEYNKMANSIAAYGLVSTDYTYIVEAYMYNDINNEKWLALVAAPIKKIEDNSISQNDLQVKFKHIEKMSISNIIQFINDSHFASHDGLSLNFTENATNNFKQIG